MTPAGGRHVHGALDSAGKRAAFALFYAPLHFIAVSEVVRARGGQTPPPKTIVDDGEWHTVVFTILDSNAEAKIYWRSPEGPQTMIIHGRSVKAFQTAGEFRIEALGDANRSFKYGYVQFRLKNKGGV